MDKTIFQRIMDGEIPATIEYQDDLVIAIRDIAPVAAVHLLIIPRKPIRSIDTLSEEDSAIVGHVFQVARNLARQFGIHESGYRIVTNTNSDAGQTVFHLHFHLIGGEHLGQMVRTKDTIPAATGSTASVSKAWTWRTYALELVAIVLLSVGLAASYNAMNPKKIDWIKKEYTSDTTTTIPLPYVPDDTVAKTVGQTQTIVPVDTIKSKIDTVKKVKDSNLVKSDTGKLKPCFEPAPGVIKEITLDVFKKLMRSPCVYLIDGRIPESYKKGHIGNAVNIDGTEAESQEQIMKMMSIPHDKFILVYCDGGHCELSHRIADVLKNFGYGPIYIYTGGWEEWSKLPK